MSVGSIPYCGDCLGLNLHPCAHVRCKVSIVIFFLLLAPGQPSAGGPRMDRRALTFQQKRDVTHGGALNDLLDVYIVIVIVIPSYCYCYCYSFIL